MLGNPPPWMKCLICSCTCVSGSVMGMVASAGADGTVALQREALRMKLVYGLCMINMTRRCACVHLWLMKLYGPPWAPKLTRLISRSLSRSSCRSLSRRRSRDSHVSVRSCTERLCTVNESGWIMSRSCVYCQGLPGSCCWGTRRRGPSPHSTARKRRVKRLLMKERVQQSCLTRYCWAATHTHTNTHTRSSFDVSLEHRSSHKQQVYL